MILAQKDGISRSEQIKRAMTIRRSNVIYDKVIIKSNASEKEKYLQVDLFIKYNVCSIMIDKLTIWAKKKKKKNIRVSKFNLLAW